jgi:hypothetical protein
MVLGCSIMSIYILDRLYQISMNHLIACHGHIMEIISGCDWLFKRSQNIGKLDILCYHQLNLASCKNNFSQEKLY